MDDLSLVGVHDDGEHLLIAAPGGQRYRLRVDDALRAAVRRDRARLSQLQVESENRLRPKEIQSRIRAGETAEEVAESAGLSLDHVRRYEGPVLAEREYVADQARQVRVQRGGSGMTLGETVAERLQQREVDVEHVTWDAWRSDDGTWTVALDFEAGSKVRQARWAYNPSVRHVSAQDDEARWLIDDEPDRGGANGQRRLAPVRDRVFDVESPMTSSAPPPPRAIPDEPSAVDLLDTLRERRGRRNRPLTEDEELAGAPDPVREAIDSLLSRADSMGDPPAAHPARSRPQEARDGEVLLLPEQLPLDSDDDEAAEPPEPVAPPVAKKRTAKGAARGRTPRTDDSNAPSESAETGDGDSAPAATGAGASPSGGARKQRRASVPSWDDIVFGQRRD